MELVAITRLKDINTAYTEGRFTYTSFRKTAAIGSGAGTWSDYSMAPGFPRPNYYIGDPLTAKTLDSRYGLWHSGNVSPYTKYVHKIQISAFNSNVAPTCFIMLDYLLYYPLIDMDSTDEQTLTNTVTLPRYTTGLGVYPMLIATNPYIGGQQFWLNYTNSAGDQNRTTLPVISNQAAFIASIIHSGNAATRSALDRGPFLPLQQGDLGVRSVQSVTFNAPNGGLAVLVLVKPICTFITGEVGAPYEVDFIKDRGMSTPTIEDGAYLNFICLAPGDISTRPLVGELTTIWS